MPPAPTPVTPNVPDRDERSTELYLRDAVALGANTTLWLGLRHTRLSRQTLDSDGNVLTDYSQSFTTPWVGIVPTP